jgi:hypothetical protein
VGLTIHYEFTVPKNWSIQTVGKKLEALRQACMDLPVVEVSELAEFKGEECQLGENKDEPFRWAKIQAARRLESAWEPGRFYHQPPHHMLVFSVDPSPGCEPMNIGICAFPPFVCPQCKSKANSQTSKPAWSLAVTDAHHNTEAARLLKKFSQRWQLRRLPWLDDYFRSRETIVQELSYRVCVVEGRHLSHRRGNAPSWVLVELEDRYQGQIRWRFQGMVEEAPTLFASPEFKADMEHLLRGEKHTIPGETGTWGSFCKTQYANEFGLPNFLRAHMTVCAILEKAQDLGFKVVVHDEGEFWTKRDVKALAEEVGQWDQMIAAMFGTMKDAAPEGVLESPIQNRADFEHLEMKGLQAGYGKMTGKIRDYLTKLKLPKAEGE